MRPPRTIQGALILLFFCPLSALAQYRFDLWTTENGLPQNTVRSILQTQDGYLWIATDNGLARFDGVRFTVFNKTNTKEIQGSRFISLCESASGDLWAVTLDGGGVRYRNGRFDTFTTTEGLLSNIVMPVDEDNDGTIWFYHEKGLSKWKDGKLTPTATVPRPPVEGCNIEFALPARGGEFQGLWCRKSKRWSRFAYGRWQELPLPPHSADAETLKIEWVHEDSKRQLWFNIRDRLTESYCLTDKGISVYKVPSGNRVFYRDNDSRLWMNNSGGEVSLSSDGAVTRIPDLRALFYMIAFEDRERSLWIGTYDRGLVRMRQQVVKVYRSEGAAETNFVYPILERRNGEIWFSSGVRGLTRLQRGRFEHFLIDGRMQTSELSSLFEDNDGSLLVGLFSGGLARFSRGQLRYERELSSQVKGRTDVIHRDRTGDLWFGAQTGLYRMRDGQLTRFDQRDGLAAEHIKAMWEGSDGSLWIGGYGGLTRYKDGRFTALTPKDGLSSDRVITLYGEESGTLWIGTYDGGLNRLKDGKLTRYSLTEGLYDNSIGQILDDKLGFLWIGGGRGIFRVRKQELEDLAEGRTPYITSTPFGTVDGLTSTDCGGGFQPASIRARDGTLWFGTSDGIAVIDPTRVPVNSTPPPIVIEGCTSGLKSIELRDGFRIEADHDMVEIKYTGLTFVKSGQMRFRYKLLGLDRDWIDAGSRRTAYYPHLPPGDYVFKVIGANNDGVWNNDGASVKVEVTPRFWQTWWFITLLGLGSIGIVALVWNYRMRQLERVSREREEFARQLIRSQESERKRIAGELHDSLGQHLVIIRNWALLGASQLDEHAPGKEELSEISETASQAITEVREIAYNLGPYHLERLGLAKTIHDMTSRIAQVSSISITTDLDHLDGTLPPEVEMNLYRVTQEALNNVVKHSMATEARVALKRDPGTVRLTITDNGAGFNPQTITGIEQ